MKRLSIPFCSLFMGVEKRTRTLVAISSSVAARTLGGVEMDLFDLSNKVAIVTGGNGGIGLGMARGLANAGATIAIVGRNVDKTQAAVSEISINLTLDDIHSLLGNITREANKRDNSDESQYLLNRIWGKLATKYNENVHVKNYC